MTSRAIRPLRGPLDAEVAVPGSKSITNRAVLAAALAAGTSRLTRLLVADDIEAMFDCIDAFGAQVEWEGATTARITGVGGRLPVAGHAYARRSGTTARFIAPVLALTDGPWVLDGDPQLRARPMADLYQSLRSLGATVVQDDPGASMPVAISGPLRGSAVSVEGSTSSQFLSGLLLAAPLLDAPIAITVTGSLVSRPFVDMTVAMMRVFGADVTVTGAEFAVRGGGYRACDVDIEPDAAAASYFFAAAAISNGRVRVGGLGSASLQGDLAFVDVLARMGAKVEVGPNGTEVAGTGELHGVDADCRDFGDMVPTLAIVAAFADGPTRLTGVGYIRSHESNRIAAIVDELRRCGVDADELEDGLIVRPRPPQAALVHSYADHRMAMAFSVMGLVVPGIEIDDEECVAKTFPEFFTVLESLDG
jgi:3-phosphoshikimate 1-carboxyvinyltransferase